MADEKRADFKVTNPSDNPMDADGKTARDREIERNQDNRAGKPEFDPRKAGVYDGGDPQNVFNKAAADLDPRNRYPTDGRPPVPGVDKPQGGSSEQYGRDRGAPTYPLPNPNNPDSPNNPSSAATRDMLAGQSSPPLPAGARTTVETPMDGSSAAQRERDRRDSAR